MYSSNNMLQGQRLPAQGLPDWVAMFGLPVAFEGWLAPLNLANSEALGHCPGCRRHGVALCSSEVVLALGCCLGCWV